MAKASKHYTRDGRAHAGASHKMPNGQVHSGRTHNQSSVRLYHYGDLSKSAKAQARKSWR
jgi:hypothetical protein